MLNTKQQKQNYKLKRASIKEKLNLLRHRLPETLRSSFHYKPRYLFILSINNSFNSNLQFNWTVIDLKY